MVDKKWKQSGVTLIELMITVAIISILAAVAYPGYQEYASKTRRSEGTSALMQIMDQQERFYTNRFPPSYTDTLKDLGYDSETITTENGYYTISAGTCTDELITVCVLLTAAPGSAQTADGTLTLDSYGTRLRGTSGSWTD